MTQRYWFWFWLQWTGGTALLLGLSVAFGLYGLLAFAGVGLGVWQGWLLRRWVPLWRWAVVTTGFGALGLFLVVAMSLVARLPLERFSLQGLLLGGVLGACLGFGQALVLRQRVARPYRWVATSTLALLVGAGWVIDLSLRQGFFTAEPYTQLIAPIAETLLRSDWAMQQICRFTIEPPPPSELPRPLQDPVWLYQCRGVSVAIAALSGLIGGTIKATGMVWLLRQQASPVQQ